MPSSKSNSSKSSSSGKRSSNSKSVDKNQNRQKKRSRTPSEDQRKRSRSNDRRRSPRKDYDSVSKSAKLFVTNIDSKYVTQEIRTSLEKQFSQFGEIKQINVKTSSGSANSYAFIEFNKTEDAQKALNSMKGKQFLGRQLKVEFGRGHRKDQDRRSDKCFICHKQGHFAKDCRYRDRSRDQRYGGRDYDRRRRHSSSQDRSPRRKRSYDRDRDRDYRRRDDRQRRQYRRSPRRSSRQSPRRDYRSDRRDRY